MPLGFMKKLASFVGAKSAEAIIPHVTKRPALLDPLVSKLVEKGMGNVREKAGDQPENVVQRRINGIKMLGEVLRRQLPRLAPNVQRRLVFNMWYNQLTKGEPVREKYREEYNEWPPTFFAISPSMRCNLRCEGCYAAEHQKYGELTPEEFNDLIRQGKEDFGSYFYTVIGGEPTAWPPIWDCLAASPDVFFQIYSHGQLIDDAMAKRAADLGNVAFALSIEGGPADTDARRGPGSYERITASMKRLQDAGVLYGFSAVHTTKNHRTLAGSDFYKDMLDRGCAFGWVFQYTPVGRAPSMELVPTPEQRFERFNAIKSFRDENPIIIFDFWNDGEITDGCMAYGRRYFHVLSSGMVEPCVFVHFSAGNIRDQSLKEIVQSAFFKDARGHMPFNEDRRAPCSFIDTPDFLREMVEKYGLKPTHEGAESIITQLHGPLKERSEKYKQMLAELSENEAKEVGAN